MSSLAVFGSDKRKENELFVCSVKTIRKLQVLLSLYDKNTAIKLRNKQIFLNLSNASINGFI